MSRRSLVCVGGAGFWKWWKGCFCLPSHPNPICYHHTRPPTPWEQRDFHQTQLMWGRCPPSPPGILVRRGWKIAPFLWDPNSREPKILFILLKDGKCKKCTLLRPAGVIMPNFPVTERLPFKGRNIYFFFFFFSLPDLGNPHQSFPPAEY